jgi:hypothetical protein
MINYLRSVFQSQRQTRSVFILAAVIYPVFLLIASLVASHEVFPPWPPGNPVRLQGFDKMMEKNLPNGGVAYWTKAHIFRAFADDDAKAQKSPLVLYEDDKPLGPGHSDHYDVEKIGLGRYSHWKDLGILFATSDNSDPNKNGRAYWAVIIANRPPAAAGDVRRLFRFKKVQEKGLPNGGVAYAAKGDEFRAFEDSDARDQRSPIVLYENDKPLGPAHSAHYDVEQIGLGRYSHWKDIGFLFSTSDNSDPNHNGRVYWAVSPPGTRAGAN